MALAMPIHILHSSDDRVTCRERHAFRHNCAVSNLELNTMSADAQALANGMERLAGLPKIKLFVCRLDEWSSVSTAGALNPIQSFP